LNETCIWIFELGYYTGVADALAELYQNLERSIFKIDNYLEFYEKKLSRFRDFPITLVEVGVFGGGSLELWKRYLHPDSKIIGVDLNPEAARFVPNGCLFFSFNQEDPKAWSDFFDQVGRVDILIDDGGHLDNQQIQTIKSVMPRLSPGGLLFIEDLFFSYRRSQGNPSNRSCISFLRNMIDELNYKYVEFSPKEVSQLALIIDEITFGTAITCISKTNKEHSYSPWRIDKNNIEILDFRNSYELTQIDGLLIRVLSKARRGVNRTFLGNNIILLRFEAIILEKIRTRGFRASK
jgi:hypothetical protein